MIPYGPWKRPTILYVACSQEEPVCSYCMFPTETYDLALEDYPASSQDFFAYFASCINAESKISPTWEYHREPQCSDVDKCWMFSSERTIPSVYARDLQSCTRGRKSTQPRSGSEKLGCRREGGGAAAARRMNWEAPAYEEVICVHNC